MARQGHPQQNDKRLYGKVATRGCRRPIYATVLVGHPAGSGPEPDAPGHQAGTCTFWVSQSRRPELDPRHSDFDEFESETVPGKSIR